MMKKCSEYDSEYDSENISHDEDDLKNKKIVNTKETLYKFKNLANELLAKDKKNKLAKQL